MHSLKELYKVGNGPSSSHTMAPKKAALEILAMYPQATFIRVVLYGSLALTGKGHLTDYIIKNTFKNINHEVLFDNITTSPHPNTMSFFIYNNLELIAQEVVYSVGGGAIKFENKEFKQTKKVYPLTTFKQIAKYCKDKNIQLYDYVYENEDIKDYLELIYNQMIKTIETGLKTEGIIPGDLQIKRKAMSLYNKLITNENSEAKEKRLLCAYAYAVNEENASGGTIVTAPTCGASGVLPAVLKHYLDKNIYNHDEIINALATAGLIGNLVKENGSISGAEAGCQAEVGTACSMAAAFSAQIQGLTINQIETAAEIALEHHLGLTCDPIKGYVQIPCIERNAVAALRAIDAAMLSSLLSQGDSKISFDLVVKTMLETGKDLGYGYRETSEGGLAKNYL